MAKMSYIRLMLVLEIYYDLEVDRKYVKNTFLNGELREKIFMKEPKGKDL